MVARFTTADPTIITAQTTDVAHSERTSSLSSTPSSASPSRPIRRKFTPQQKQLNSLQDSVDSKFRTFLSKYGDETVSQFDTFAGTPVSSKGQNAESQRWDLAHNATTFLEAHTTQAEASTLVSGFISSAKVTETTCGKPMEGWSESMMDARISALRGTQTLLSQAIERHAREIEEGTGQSGQSGKWGWGTKVALASAGAAALSMAGYYGPSFFESVCGTTKM